MKRVLAKYKNGNYNVILFEDGTKIRFNKLDNLTPDFAESIDVTITTKCDKGCPWCYMNCTMEGKHANLNLPFFDTLHAGQELALNGNDLSHPDLETFLLRMKAKGVICNLTVNQWHFIKYYDRLYNWMEQGLIYGLGISLTDSTELRNFFKTYKRHPNMVIHTIDGLLTEEDINNLQDMKILILGYKVLGRGDHYYDEHKDDIATRIEWLKKNIMNLAKQFECVSFDNLSIEHLELNKNFTKEEWEQFYMGDEGAFTFFVDAVNETYAMSSLEKENNFQILDNVDDMFKHVRQISRNK